MSLTRDSRETIIERAGRDRAFANALYQEAVDLFLGGDSAAARLVLRDLVKATGGFEDLSVATERPSKSLIRMFSPKGNPSMDNLALVFGVLRKKGKFSLVTHMQKSRGGKRTASRGAGGAVKTTKKRHAMA